MCLLGRGHALPPLFPLGASFFHCQMKWISVIEVGRVLHLTVVHPPHRTYCRVSDIEQLKAKQHHSRGRTGSAHHSFAAAVDAVVTSISTVSWRPSYTLKNQNRLIKVTHTHAGFCLCTFTTWNCSVLKWQILKSSYLLLLFLCSSQMLKQNQNTEWKAAFTRAVHTMQHLTQGAHQPKINCNWFDSWTRETQSAQQLDSISFYF